MVDLLSAGEGGVKAMNCGDNDPVQTTSSRTASEAGVGRSRPGSSISTYNGGWIGSVSKPPSGVRKGTNTVAGGGRAKKENGNGATDDEMAGKERRKVGTLSRSADSTIAWDGVTEVHVIGIRGVMDMWKKYFKLFMDFFLKI